MYLKLKEKASSLFKKTLGQKAVFGAVLSVFICLPIILLLIMPVLNVNAQFGTLTGVTNAPTYETFDLNSIQLQLDVFVGPKQVKDNFVRVGLKDGVLRIGAEARMLAASKCESESSCVKPTPANKMDLSNADVYFQNRKNDGIKNFLFGVRAKENIGNFTCKEYEKPAATYGTSVSFMTCSVPFYKSGRAQQGIITISQDASNNLAYKDDFAINAADFAKLGLTAAGTRYSLYVYTGMEVNLTNQRIFFPLGKEIFVETYATQAEADKADAEIGRPSDVTNYGAIAGTAESKTPLSGIPKLIADIFVGISSLFIYFTYELFSKLVAPMLEGVLSIRVYTDQFVNVIYPGWEVLRNVVNIYFIVAIIAIAMATLFRVESYKFKHLLVQLIIAALIVNFSLVISQAVLGVADTVQNQFLPNNAQVIRELGKDLMPNRILEIINSSQFASGSFFATASTSLFFMALAIGSFLVFCGILAFLVIRIVMLWILLMLSPLAYAAGVLPSTASMRGKWWGEFLKYAFFTPIMAFFLNMAAIIAVNYEYVFRDINTNVAATAEWKGFATLVFAVASNVLLLVFLIAALKIAEQFGIYGADKITEIAKKGMFMPFKATAGAVAVPTKFFGKRAGGYLGMKYNEWTSKLVTDDHGLTGNLKKAAYALVNPVNFFRGWGERAKEKKEWAHEVAKGAGQVVASELLTLGKEKIDYKQMAFQRIQQKMVSKLREALGDDVSRAASMDLQGRVLFLKGFEGQIVKGAVSRLTNSPGWGDDTNEVLFSKENIKKVRSQLAIGTEGKGLALFDAAAKDYNDEGWLVGEYIKQGLDLDWLAKMKNLKTEEEQKKFYVRNKSGHFENKEFEKWISEENVQRGLMNIEALTDGAKKVGHYEQMFGAKKDEKIGKFIPLVDSNWARDSYRQAIKEGKTGEALATDLAKGLRTSEIMSEEIKIDSRQYLRQSSPFPLLPKVHNQVEDTWGYGGIGQDGENLTLLQLANWQMLGPEHIARSAESQVRIIKRLAGDFLDRDGTIRPEKAEEFYNKVKINPQWMDAMRNVYTTGAPYLGKVGELHPEALIEEAENAVIMKTKPGTAEAAAAGVRIQILKRERELRIKSTSKKKKNNDDEEEG